MLQAYTYSTTHLVPGQIPVLKRHPALCRFLELPIELNFNGMHHKLLCSSSLIHFRNSKNAGSVLHEGRCILMKLSLSSPDAGCCQASFQKITHHVARPPNPLDPLRFTRRPKVNTEDVVKYWLNFDGSKDIFLYSTFSDILCPSLL
jgi:hypothetical protein